MRYSLQYCQVLNNITVATKIKPKILQNLTHLLYYLLKLIEWQRILYRVNLVGLAQGSHLQYTVDPLINTVMTHSSVKCLKPAYHKEQKKLWKGHIVGLAQELPQSHLQYTDDPFLTQKVHGWYLVWNLLVCSLLAAACVDLCRSVGRNRMVGFLPRQLTSHH